MKIKLDKPVQFTRKSDPLSEVIVPSVTFHIGEDTVQTVDEEDITIPAKHTLSWMAGQPPFAGNSETLQVSFSQKNAPKEVWAALQTIIDYVSDTTKEELEKESQ